MEDNFKRRREKEGWVFLIFEFLENINWMMAMKVKERIREEKNKIKKRAIGIFIFFLGMIIFLIGLSVLVSSIIGLVWSGWLIVGGGLVLISAIFLKS